MRSAHVAALAMSVLFHTLPAHSQELSGPEIKKLISGKAVYLSTPFGIEFPLRYSAGGVVTGDASGFKLASALTPKESGSWWVEDSQMCQKWPTWYDGKTFCFSISSIGADKISWVRNDGTKGTARIVD